MADTRQPAAGTGAAGDHGGLSVTSRTISGGDRDRRPLAEAVAHLEYLGYEVGLEASGWRYAGHPYRYHFHLQAFAHGIRLHCGAGIGASMGNSRAAWLDFLNSANDRSHVVRFSLVEGKDGLYHIRMRALVTGAYSRSVFAMVMDMWHDDVDIVRRRPEFPPEIPAGEGKDAAAVTVN